MTELANKQTCATLKNVLDSAAAQKSKKYLDNDPLSFCHRFTNCADQEVAALIAASFAYGNVAIILKNLEKIFAALGSSPAKAVDSYEPKLRERMFGGFKHRFNDSHDLSALLWSLRIMRQESGSVERFFLRFYDSASPDMTVALNRFCQAVLSFDYTPVFGHSSPPSSSYFPFLFPAPSAGSACKRLCMFLRWVVRPNDGIDLGLWGSVSPRDLIIPVDTHISRIAGYLGLTGRKQADWKMAQEITASLRILDPDDPVKYDFAIAHLGISERCNGFDPAQCQKCPIAPVCRQTRRNPQ